MILFIGNGLSLDEWPRGRGEILCASVVIHTLGDRNRYPYPAIWAGNGWGIIYLLFVIIGNFSFKTSTPRQMEGLPEYIERELKDYGEIMN